MNFPSTPVWLGDIRQLTAAEALRIAGIKVGQLDLLDGSPPCTSFSAAGTRRGEADECGQLWLEFARLLDGIKPRAFIMENTDGLVKFKANRPLVKKMLNRFERTHRVTSGVLCAADYGVPQVRNRFFAIGIRRDLEVEPSLPAKTVTRHITVREAWHGLPAIQIRSRPGGGAKALVPLIAQGRDGADVHPRQSYYGVVRTAWNAPARTIMATHHTTAMTLHPDLNESISVAEALRLQGFPDGYRLIGTTTQRMKQVGNAVPPKMSEAIGRHIRKLLGL